MKIYFFSPLYRMGHSGVVPMTLRERANVWEMDADRLDQESRAMANDAIDDSHAS